MNKQTLLIAGLAVAFLSSVSYIVYLEYNPKIETASSAPASLEEARERIKRRLAKLQVMTPEQWEAERKKDPKRPATLEEAIEKNKTILTSLYDVNQEQWDAMAQEVQTRKDALAPRETIGKMRKDVTAKKPVTETYYPIPYDNGGQSAPFPYAKDAAEAKRQIKERSKPLQIP
ncbi:MAG: hypothetical protein SFT92_09795 [Rickettsiales bacterium]|nr:hypothetical protein [Rickettsiales bacterium]